jgi:hypothetical protein
LKPALLTALLLCAGMGAGYYLGSRGPISGSRGGRTDTREVHDLRDKIVQDDERIRELLARIAELERRLAAIPTEESPYPGDTPEDVEKVIADAYSATNVDWLLDAIDRLLCMGEKGYPLLRRLIIDIAFKAKFVPTMADFRFDQLYRVGRIFANREKQFIGFLNYLLTEKDTPDLLKQFALVGGAFYVGSDAPGSADLQQTMTQAFMQKAIGEGAFPGGALPSNMPKKMQVFVMAMSGSKEMIAPLHDEYNQTKDKDLQSDIVGALAYLGDPNALPLIKDRLDPTQGDYSRELRALGRIGTDDAHATATAFLRQVPDSKRFYRQARAYMNEGGGVSAVLLIRERIQSDPKDPEIGSTIGALRRFPTQESLDTLNLIASTTPDKQIQQRASDAATEVDQRLKGILPEQK